MNGFTFLGITFLVVGLWLIVSFGLTPGGAVVQDAAGAYTFTDDWGRLQTDVIYTWDKHAVELALNELLKENHPDVKSRHWRRAP